MSSGSHEIRCPCCGALICVDAATGTVLSHDPPKREHRSFEEVALEVSQERKRTESKFKQAMEERAHQSEILEKKFRKAAEKAAEDPSRPKSPFDLD